MKINNIEDTYLIEKELLQAIIVENKRRGLDISKEMDQSLLAIAITDLEKGFLALWKAMATNKDEFYKIIRDYFTEEEQVSIRILYNPNNENLTLNEIRNLVREEMSKTTEQKNMNFTEVIKELQNGKTVRRISNPEMKYRLIDKWVQAEFSLSDFEANDWEVV